MGAYPHGRDFGTLSSSGVWLLCACKGYPKMSMALHAGGSVCGSTVDHDKREHSQTPFT